MIETAGAEGEGGRSVQYRHLCGGPFNVQALGGISAGGADAADME